MRRGCGFIDPFFPWLQDEVRELGRLPALNVPDRFIKRHPFPGEPTAVLYTYPTGLTKIKLKAIWTRH